MDNAALNYNAIANLDDGSCEYTALGGQDITLLEGWNTFSTYVSPTDPSIDVVLNSIEENIIIVKNNLGETYLPEWNYNAIGNLNNAQGYQIKVSTTSILTIEGALIAPESHAIPIAEGWNTIAYLRSVSADASLVLEGIANQLTIVKDYLGDTYIPQWNFNGIGQLEPGQGYFLRSNAAVALNYLPNTVEYRTTLDSQIKNTASNVDFELNSGSNMHLDLPESSWNINVTEQDELYAYDAQGTLVGTVKITLPNTVLCIWGDDDLTKEKEGLYPMENITYKLWSAADRELKILEIIQPKQNSFTQNELVVGQAANLSEAIKTLSIFDAISNPAKNQTLIRFFLNEDSHLRLELFDIVGTTIQEISSGNFERGYHKFILELNDFSAGTYLYQMTCNGTRKSKRIQVIK